MNQDIIQQILLPLLTKPYVKISSLANFFHLSASELEDYINVLEKQIVNLGLQLEIIELNNEDYVILYFQSKNSELSDLKIGLLCVIAHLCKQRGGYLTQNIKEILDSAYEQEMQFLKTHFYIEKSPSGLWFISPLGFLTVFPVLSKTASLLNSLI